MSSLDVPVIEIPWNGTVSRVRLVKVSPVVINVDHVSMGGTVRERRTVVDALLCSQVEGERDEYLVARRVGDGVWREVASYVDGEADPAGYDPDSLGRSLVPVRLSAYLNEHVPRTAENGR